MDSNKQINVLVFGLGAIGGFYAFILGQNPNVSLSVVARSNYNDVKTSGLHIESQNHGNHKVKIDQVCKSAFDCGRKFDYIVCTHKAVRPDAIPELFQTTVNETTTFVIIQNGVGNEDPFRKLYPNNSIVTCVTWVGARQVSPGLIRHTKSEDMQIGLFPSLNIDPQVEKLRLDSFARLLRKGGTAFQIADNIQLQRWSKVVWNCAWNPLTTLTMVDTQTWLKSSQEAMPMTRQLMREVIDVARRCNVPIGYNLIDTHMEKILAMPGIGSSMQTDAKEGRPLEVDVILGYPMKRARELGMDFPVLSMVYALTMAVDGRLAKL